ncbi:thioredoxin TrxC [Marinicellulosiphila megalodicopiae]|uniref:thioredoxin TrxC n=1 Tax=Marinicellulosiphila megalodicopiae TaxID=2724896 RepID=UPI003BB18636
MKIVCPSCHRANNVPQERLQENPNCGACKQKLFTAKPINLSDATFAKHILNSELPILVDFWAEWCGPCKMMAPILDGVASKVDTQLRVAKVETDLNPQLGQQYNIRSIPTLAVFKGGKEIARQAGAMSESQLMDWLSSVLK